MNKPILAITLNPAIDKVYAVDDFAIGGVFRPRAMTATAGGKGLNVARVAHLLGEPVAAGGFIGGGNGRFIAEQVRESGIATAFVPIRGESRICINITDRNSVSTEVLEPGPQIRAKECDRFIAAYRRLLVNCAVVTASGSLPQGVPADFYRTLIGVAHVQKIRFLLDSSGEALARGMEGAPYLIKPNQEEAEKLLGMELTTVEAQAGAIVKFRAQGIELPCITLGKNGCMAGLADGVYHFYGPALEVVNSVGSGDSFIAGCAVGIARQQGLVETIKLGMAAGMANTQFFQTGVVSLELVEQLYGQIRFERVRSY
jgi:tagatose 6-phosphate kinase